mgnify:CR=1 FL=1|jgi:glycosyltransferase involved in cell wall biosynthesis
MLTTGFPRYSGDLFGSFILQLARALVEQKLEVAIVAPHAADAARSEAWEGVQIRRFRYVWPATWQRLAYGGGIPSNIRVSWISRLQIPFFLICFWWAAIGACRRSDLVHCHWTVSGLVACLAMRLYSRPVILSVRGSDVHLVTGRALGWLNRRICRCMDVVIAVSEDIAAKLERAGVDRKKIRVVYNGVGSEFSPRDRQMARRELGLPESRFIVIFVGLLVPVKGVEFLLEALPLLNDSNVYCVLVGDGVSQSELEAKARDLGIAEQVQFVGRRAASEVPLWISSADVLALPSLSEGRPNVVLEAQACGIPVVATRVGGTPELVRDGQTGLLVEPGSAASMARGLGRLLGDAPFRDSIGRAGRAMVEEGDSTWEASAAKVHDIYRELLPGSEAA